MNYFNKHVWASSLVGLRDPAVISPPTALPLYCVRRRRTGNQKTRQTLTEQVCLYRSGKGTRVLEEKEAALGTAERTFQKEKEPALCRGLDKKVTVSLVRRGWDEAEKWSRSWYRTSWRVIFKEQPGNFDMFWAGRVTSDLLWLTCSLVAQRIKRLPAM